MQICNRFNSNNNTSNHAMPTSLHAIVSQYTIMSLAPGLAHNVQASSILLGSPRPQGQYEYNDTKARGVMLLLFRSKHSHRYVSIKVYQCGFLWLYDLYYNVKLKFFDF